MAKGQQKSKKEVKKPKKDTSVPVLVSTVGLKPVVTTTIFPKGKEKKVK